MRDTAGYPTVDEVDRRLTEEAGTLFEVLDSPLGELLCLECEMFCNEESCAPTGKRDQAAAVRQARIEALCEFHSRLLAEYGEYATERVMDELTVDWLPCQRHLVPEERADVYSLMVKARNAYREEVR